MIIFPKDRENLLKIIFSLSKYRTQTGSKSQMTRYGKQSMDHHPHLFTLRKIKKKSILSPCVCNILNMQKPFCTSKTIIVISIIQ